MSGMIMTNRFLFLCHMHYIQLCKIPETREAGGGEAACYPSLCPSQTVVKLRQVGEFLNKILHLMMSCFIVNRKTKQTNSY